MTRILFCISFFFIGFITKAQTKDSIIHYPIVVEFQSVCCGVPSEVPLVSFLKKFKKTNKIKKIKVYKIGPLGREGEYHLGFKLTEFNRAQKKSFIKKLKQIVPKLNDKGLAVVNEKVDINLSNFSSNVTVELIYY
jgi:uncharacterized protein YjhX (UPF0386 family)